MKKIIKNNLMFFISLLILVFWGFYTVITEYLRTNNQIIYNKEYLKTCGDSCMDVFTHPFDAITTFFSNIGNTGLSLIENIAPIFVIVPTVYYFYRKLKKGNIKNILTRETYQKTMLKNYLQALKSTLILPIFLTILFIITFFTTGNFDINYTFSHGGSGYTFASETDIRNFIVFIPTFFLVIWLHSIFWANLGIISVKKNKSVASASIYAYIYYYLIVIILEVFIGEWLFSGSWINAYLSLGNIWLFYEANYLGMILFAVLLVVISTLIVYLSYRNKEETIKECEKK